MAAYRRVYDLRHLLADCQEPGSAPVPYARYSSMGYLYLYHFNQLLKIVSEALLLTYLQIYPCVYVIYTISVVLLCRCVQ